MKTLYLSLGPSCQTVYYLDKLRLRKFSSPLDWLLYDLETAIELYKKDFNTFFCEYREEKSNMTDRRQVFDTKNHILSMHNISDKKSLADAVEEYRKTVLRRWNRLKNEIQKYDKVIFFSAYNYNYDTLKYYLKQLDSIFKHKKIILVNMFSSEIKKNRKYHKIGKNLVLIEYFFPNDQEDTWIGNETEWQKAIAEVYLEKYKDQ